MKLDVTEVSNLIEAHFKDSLRESGYEVVTKKAIDLLTYNRFDLAFKLFYLDMKNKNNELATNIYIEHIRAFSLDKFIEPGNEDKNSIEKFIEEFDKTFNSIQNHGFNSEKTLIPLSKNNSISNGSHRVASAIYLKKKVSCVKIHTVSSMYDYKFFYHRNISVEILDKVATKFIEFASNVHIAFLWPIGKSNREMVDHIIPNIVYKKTIQLNYNGAHNLLSQIYYGEEWLGNKKNNFAGSKGKIIQCFKTFDKFEVIAFQADNLVEVLKIKNKIRELFNVGKHSIHITDTKEEALRVSNIVFNDNSLHFLKYAKPNQYLITYEILKKHIEFLNQNNISLEDTILDDKIVLSVYGLCEPSNIKYFTNDRDILYDSKYYFYFNDMKFISLSQLYKMKIKRAKQEDINDCKLIKPLIENNKLKEILDKIKQYIYYKQLKLKVGVINFLKIIGLLNTVKKLYKSIKHDRK
jgi:hypothetical protein